MEDDACVEVFKAILDFFNSEDVNNLQDHFLDEFRVKFRAMAKEFLDSDLLSNSVSESVKSSQCITCLDATHKVLGPDGFALI